MGFSDGSYGNSSSRLGILHPVRAKTSSGTAHHRSRLTVRHPQFTGHGFLNCHDADLSYRAANGRRHGFLVSAVPGVKTGRFEEAYLQSQMSQRLSAPKTVSSEMSFRRSSVPAAKRRKLTAVLAAKPFWGHQPN